MENKKYTVEPHGSGHAIYRGRDQSHHGSNLGLLSECDDGLPHLIEVALNSAAETEDSRQEMRDKILSLEFRLAQEQRKNEEHEKDYLAVWKAVKEPDETVVEAVRRVVRQRDTAIRDLEETRRGGVAGGDDQGGEVDALRTNRDEWRNCARDLLSWVVAFRDSALRERWTTVLALAEAKSLPVSLASVELLERRSSHPGQSE